MNRHKVIAIKPDIVFESSDAISYNWKSLANSIFTFICSYTFPTIDLSAQETLNIIIGYIKRDDPTNKTSAQNYAAPIQTKEAPSIQEVKNTFHLTRKEYYELKNNINILVLLRNRVGTKNDKEICEIAYFTSGCNISRAEKKLKEHCKDSGTSSAFTTLKITLSQIAFDYEESKRKIFKQAQCFKVDKYPKKKAIIRNSNIQDELSESFQRVSIPREQRYRNKNTAKVYNLLRTRINNDNDNEICKIIFFTSQRNIEKSSVALKEACKNTGTHSAFQSLRTELLRVYSSHKESEREMLKPNGILTNFK
ncbi:hypothetical protein HOG98_08455 [bacterium]|jgi:hypothetical protein|nr:hypothetical protein [bacterium]